MSYQVTARKWRPQNFDEVVGQEIVTRTLQNAIKSERIAHAFLFSGVRGVGKTTTARILAKALNCLKGPTVSPCGQCDSCQEITGANSVDVLEIDAASNTGVDNIRDLRESVRYGTARDRFKIYIIDEVHMLSKGAFNALLKTLEEPPPHVKFILATTELERIPATITSRCQHFTFKPIPFSLILGCLKEITRQEGIEITEYGLRCLVSLAGGSMRDAQSVLDQIVAFAGKQISDEDVRVLLGVVDEQVLGPLVEAVARRDRKEIIGSVEELRNSGVDPQIFCAKLVHHLRDLMVYQVTGWEESLLDLPDSARETLDKQAQEFSKLDLIRFYDLMVGCQSQLRYHSHPYVHLEMTMIKFIELAQLPSIEEVITRLESGQAPRVTEPPDRPQAESRDLLETSSPEAVAGPGGEKVKPSVPARSDQEPMAPSPDQLIVDLFSSLQTESPLLYSSMRQAAEVDLSEKKLFVVFAHEEKIHKDLLLEPKHRKQLAELCAKITRSTPQLEVKLLAPVAQEADPREDPKVRAFVKTFPGRVIVEKKVEE